MTARLRCYTCDGVEFIEARPFDWRCARCNDGHVRYVEIEDEQ